MNEELKKAAEKWVFETNGHKWSNNDNTVGDNFGSFIAGAEWAFQQQPALANLEQVWNAITANGSREMDFERFQQAVKECGVKAQPVENPMCQRCGKRSDKLLTFKLCPECQ